MSFKRTNYAYESLSQVWFQRGYRALGLSWRSGVVLHDSWWRCAFKGQTSVRNLTSPKLQGLGVDLCATLDKFFKNVKHRVFKLMLSLIANVGKVKLRTFYETHTQTFFRSGHGTCRWTQHERCCPKPKHAHAFLATRTNADAGHDPPPNV